MSDSLTKEEQAREHDQVKLDQQANHLRRDCVKGERVKVVVSAKFHSSLYLISLMFIGWIAFVGSTTRRAASYSSRALTMRVARGRIGSRRWKVTRKVLMGRSGVRSICFLLSIHII